MIDAARVRGSTGRTGFALLLAVLAALPGLVARYPQMADYPAHLARWHIMLDHGRSPWLARYYAIDWHWIPNLGVDLLIGPLAGLFGLTAAGRIVVIAIPLLTGLGLVAVDRALGRRVGAGTALAFCTIWSPALLMGFLNFSLAAALALLALALWLTAEGKSWRAPAFVVIAPLLWLCHLSGWAALCVMVFACEWDRRGFLRAIPVTWPLWPPFVLSLLTGSGSAGMLAYGDGVVIDKLSNWVKALCDQDFRADLLVTALLIAVPLIALARGRIDWRMGRAALLFAALSVVLPRHLGGGDFADYRLVPLALMAWCMAIRWEGPAWLLAVAALPFVGRLAITTAAWERNSQETARLLTALDRLPPGARVAGVIAEEGSAWAQPVFTHVHGWAVVRKDALTNGNFAIPGVHMLRVRGEDPKVFADPAQRLFVRPGERPDLAAFPAAARADWLWYVGPGEPLRLPDGARVVHRTSHSLLARLANPPVRR